MTTHDFNLQWGLLRLSMAIKNRFITAAADQGLTGLQAITLCMLRLDEPCTMSAIAKLASCDPSNLSDSIDKLVHAGYVTRQESPADRRNKLLVLTAAGQTLREQLYACATKQGLLCDHTLTAAEDEEFHRLVIKACVS